MKNNLDFLDNIGLDKKTSEPVVGLVEKAIEKTIIDAQNTLRKKGKTYTGASADIVFTINNSTITIGHKNKASKYALFLDAGVNGTIKKHGAPYSFKSQYPSREMVANIKAWLKNGKLKNRKEDQKKGLNKVQKKRKDQSKLYESAAYGIAMSIKRNGLKPTFFLSNAIKKNFGDKFIKDFAKEFGKAIKINIKNGNYNK